MLENLFAAVQHELLPLCVVGLKKEKFRLWFLRSFYDTIIEWKLKKTNFYFLNMKIQITIIYTTTNHQPFGYKWRCLCGTLQTIFTIISTATNPQPLGYKWWCLCGTLQTKSILTVSVKNNYTRQNWYTWSEIIQLCIVLNYCNVLESALIVVCT